MNEMFQVEVAYGDWEDYREDPIYITADLEDARRVVAELREAVYTCLRQDYEGLAMRDYDTVEGYIASHVENRDCQVRIRRLPVGVVARIHGGIVEVHNWEPVDWTAGNSYYDETEVSHYEHVAEVYEIHFDNMLPSRSH